MKNKSSLVSVVIPVRNAGEFFAECIASILNQTYKNLEVIVVNDASTDSTPQILSSLKNKKVKIFTNKKQQGVTRSANLAISKAKATYIARMDADDIASLDRIEKQVNFLKKNSTVVAVGGQCELIDAEGRVFGRKTFPLLNSKIKNMIFSNVPVQQPTLMIDKSRLPKDFVWYDENYSSAEELELLFKLFKYGEVANLKDILLQYRIHNGNTSLKNPKKTFFLTLKTRFSAIFKYAYKPSIEGLLTTFIQAIVVSLIPEKWIYPIYSMIRGMDVNLTPQKAIELD